MKIFINKDKHLGDLWATLSYCVVNDAEIVIDDKCDKDRINFIKNLLYNFYNSENIKVEVGKKEEGTERIRNHSKMFAHPYRMTKLLYENFTNKICYAFTANWKKEEKIPPWISQLEEKLKSIDAINIIKPMDINEAIGHLTACKFFITVDSGLAHIARSVGCPLYIIKYKLDITRPYPKEFCDHTVIETLEEACKLI